MARRQHQIGEALFVIGFHAARLAIECKAAAAAEVAGKCAFEQIHIHRRCALDQTVAFVEADLGNHDPGLAEQCRLMQQLRTAAIGQLIAARVGWVLARDAIRIGEGQNIADIVRADFCLTRVVDAQTPAPLFGRLIDAGQPLTIRAIMPGAPAAQRLQCRDAGAQIVAAPRLTAHRIARLDQRRNIAGQALQRCRRAPHRIGQTRMHAEFEQ